MATGMFDTLTEDELRSVLNRQAERETKRNDDQWKLTEDFLENRQIERTATELKKRYPQRQALSKGEQIQPFILPIADRYVAEAANAYNQPVTRELIDEDGEVDKETTEALKGLTEGLDEKLHQIERYTVAQDAQPGFVQPRRGKLDVQPAPLHQVYPVLPHDASKVNRADQNDYLGHVVEVDRIEGEKRKWVFATPAAHYLYESDQWHKADNVEIIKNEMEWPQQDEGDKENVESHPLQTLVWWHRYIPMNKLLPVSDVPVAALNLEINVQLSCLLDTIRKQGFSQVYANVMDKANPPASVAFGTGFMLALDVGEEIGALTLPNDYGGMIQFYEFLVQLFAILLRQSPNDFAIGGTSPASGFAKMVDSLPKIEARTDRIRRLTTIEEEILWPRIGAVGRYLDKLPSGVEKLRMRARFADVDFPMQIDETIKEDEHRIKHGWTTDAKLYAERNGVSLEEAEKLVEENLSKTKPQPGEQQPGQPQQSERRSIAELVASRRSQLNGGSDDDA